MKKILGLLLCWCMLASVLPQTVLAEEHPEVIVTVNNAALYSDKNIVDTNIADRVEVNTILEPVSGKVAVGYSEEGVSRLVYEVFYTMNGITGKYYILYNQVLNFSTGVKQPEKTTVAYVSGLQEGKTIGAYSSKNESGTTNGEFSNGAKVFVKQTTEDGWSRIYVSQSLTRYIKTEYLTFGGEDRVVIATPIPTTVPTVIPDEITTPEPTPIEVPMITPEPTPTEVPPITPEPIPTEVPIVTPEPISTVTEGVATMDLGLYTAPNNLWADCVYEVPQNGRVELVSTEKIPAIDGSDFTYYLAAWKQDNTVNYYYILSDYVNVYESGFVLPVTAEAGVIADVKEDTSIEVFAAQNEGSQVLGYVANGAEVDILSTSTGWTEIAFNSGSGYIPTADENEISRDETDANKADENESEDEWESYE